MLINYHVTGEERKRLVKTIASYEGMMNCEGAERDRYTNIYLALISGAKVCKDEPDNE